MEVKSGQKTTEFWVTLAIQVVGILFLIGVFTPEQKEAMEIAVPQAAELYTQGAALVAMVASAFGYALSRGMAKKNGK
jgi:hypothetical protein